MKKLFPVATAAFCLAVPAFAQDAEAEGAPSPNAVVDAAPENEWVSIAAEDLLVMTLAPDRDGNERTVIIQLMPAPFSQGWVENIRTFARAKWYDGITVNRVQDNYVVQWGDPNYDNPEAEGEAKALPDGLRVIDEKCYLTDFLDDECDIPASSVEQIAEEMAQETENLMGFLDEPKSRPDIESTKTDSAPKGWHERDSYAPWVEFYNGWPLAGEPKLDDSDYVFWPIHCYGMIGVGRGYSPDTGSGAELYTVIGHAPRHLDRNIALVGRIVEGMEHLSSLPRGSGALGFYTEDEFGKRTPIQSVRVASDLSAADQPAFEYLSTEDETFARYADARANRRDPFFIVPAGGADICNIPVPVRRASE